MKRLQSNEGGDGGSGGDLLPSLIIKYIPYPYNMISLFISHLWYNSFKNHRISLLPEDSLERRNYFLQECHILFDEQEHAYTITKWCEKERRFIRVVTKKDCTSRKEFISVSLFKSGLFAPFIKEDALALARRGLRAHLYQNMSDEEVFELWEKTRQEGSGQGSRRHYWIECYYNKSNLEEIDLKDPVWLFFKDFESAHVTNKLEPFRSEMRLCDMPLKLTGTPDMLYRYSNKEKELRYTTVGDNKIPLLLYDWKTNKKFQFTNRYQSGITSLTRNLDKCEYNEFLIQLTTYKAMFERNYPGYYIRKMYILLLNEVYGKFCRIPLLPTDQLNTETLSAYRLSEIK